MKRGFEQENRYTLSKHAAEFKNKVNFSWTLHDKALIIGRQNLDFYLDFDLNLNFGLLFYLCFKVRVLIENDEERATFYEALKDYQRYKVDQFNRVNYFY